MARAHYRFDICWAGWIVATILSTNAAQCVDPPPVLTSDDVNGGWIGVTRSGEVCRLVLGVLDRSGSWSCSFGDWTYKAQVRDVDLEDQHLTVTLSPDGDQIKGVLIGYRFEAEYGSQQSITLFPERRIMEALRRVGSLGNIASTSEERGRP